MGWTRRRVVALAGAIGWGCAGDGRAVAAPPATTVRTIAAMTHVALPPPPLAMAMVRVTLPDGVDAPSATAGGVRIIVLETGSVVARVGARGGFGPDTRRPLASPGDIPIPPGDALALAAADLAALRNPGGNPVVVLDAAIFPAEDRPPPALLVTPDGVHVRLLAFGVIDALPLARFDVTLLDIETDPGGDIPPSLAIGPMLARLETGTAVVAAAGPGVFASSSSGQTSLAGIGPGNPALPGDIVRLPFGSALFLRPGAVARIAAGGPSPARLLILRLGESEIG